MPYEPTTNFKDSNNVDLGKKLVTKDYLLEVYGTILENSPASGLVVTPELWGWGNGFYLGINASGNRNTPVTTFAGGTNWKSVACGYNHTAAIKTDGSLWTWGSGADGRLGTNDTTDRGSQVTTFAGGNDWKSISGGEKFTAAIKTDGSLWTWGLGTSGQLGNFDNTTRTTPVTTFAGGTNWKSVACGYNHTAAIKTDGSLWSWGINSNGQLGINNTDNRSTPVTTFAGGNTWKSVACGRDHTLAIKTDGSLWGWGAGGHALGTNDSPFGQKNTPVTTFAGGNNWKSVGGGRSHSAAIKTDGSLWTWGNNSSAQLGTNNTTDRSTPVTTFAGGNNWKSIDCGGYYTLAIKTDGSLWVWGQNFSGFLGVNDTNSRSTPVTTFAGGNDWKQVASARVFTHAIKSIDYI